MNATTHTARDLESAREDARRVRAMISKHSPTTTTDSLSWGGLGGRITGRKFDAKSLADLLAAANRKISRIRKSLAK